MKAAEIKRANITNAVAQNLAGTGIPGTQALATGANAFSKGVNKLDRMRVRHQEKLKIREIK
jgi:hypothetical protein